MKKNLLVIFALLAMGFGARQVFLLAEEWRGRSHTAHPAVAEASTVEIQVAEVSLVTEVPVVETEIAETQTTEPQATKAPNHESQGENLFYLLRPHLKDAQENPVADAAK